ncbi:MAG: hypothetical protein ABSE49_09240 [Polyangiaceae bacterium]
MTNVLRRSIRRGLFGALSLAALFAAVPAMADGEAPTRRDELPLYPIEIEPHVAFGAGDVYGATGLGAGLRLSIPVISGHLGQVPDNLAIGFGADFLHYDNCYYGNDCGANYLMLPAVAQWNIFVARRVSVFGEGGIFVYKGFFNGCGPGDGPGCSPPSDFGVLPTVAIGARIHVGDNVSFVARLGYPTITLGVSFL